VQEIVQKSFHIQEERSERKRGTKVDTLILREGGAVELDDFRSEESVAAKESNSYCTTCRVKNRCTEGPYAMRITANGFFKPCLIRRDNEVQI
jgi:hypothetical protein